MYEQLRKGVYVDYPLFGASPISDYDSANYKQLCGKGCSCNGEKYKEGESIIIGGFYEYQCVCGEWVIMNN